ncbi:MAG TPA: diguanylate cyclase [Ideonella sp.]|uniref:diguanylate cyclase n=1 Tax=Ideonella sp. TaxID=1929293 RepID=UPI002E31E299|nr:diguanylate cyclase [Ideonella sp.]HEX5685110.1 diguanylate cyclase [Ideonella sp.]
MAEVDERIRSATTALQVLAASPALASEDLRAFHMQARTVLPYQAGNNFVLSDTTGQQEVNTLLAFGEPLPRHGNPPLQQAVIASKEPVVSDLFIGGVTRRPLVAVEVPVTVDGRMTHTLAMGFFPDRFAGVLANLQPETDWVVSLFDRTGTIVARTHAAERYVGQKGAAELLAAMARSDRGVMEIDTLEGTPVIAAFWRSPVTGWSVAVGVPRQALMAPLQRWLLILVVSATALLALGVGIAVLLSRRIAGSIEALIAPSEALGRGEPVQVGALPLKEADAVGCALRRAATLLQQRTDERDLHAQASLEARVQARRLAHVASHDSLTGLSNRAHFLELVEQRVDSDRSDKRAFAIFFVDLDDFKPINDRYGHMMGDKLLRCFAARLQEGVRGTDHVARLGGDEFAVLLDDLSPKQAGMVAAVLSERLSRPYTIDHLTLRVSACVGVACCPEDGTSADALMAAADAAMYRAKAGGKGRFEMSRPSDL